MTEILDVVNENDQIIGQKNLAEVMKKGLLHRSVHGFILDSKGRFFCRKITRKSPVYAGYWSTGIGAHVSSEEEYDSTAREALGFLLGLHCPLENIGKIRVQDEVENEISAVYVGYSEELIQLNKEKLDDGQFFSLADLNELIKKERCTPHLALSLKQYLEHKKTLK
ncbi:MAG TPA: hypothetical protein VJG90_08020 [Candidatus Nanoarchaeia archaeon]|nr:hypothetical protein [Candidatus Nanoarchaeia archaeon]